MSATESAASQGDGVRLSTASGRWVLVAAVLVRGWPGGVFFLLVVDLQVVAGTALLPVTVIMLLLSARGGALVARIVFGLGLSLIVAPLTTTTVLAAAETRQ
ncbi:hypothetical protein [Jatrophihabitans lederbergiae]|uniref:Uncharacterized protein n=1 Tax=Jatrophihabitans lederbergiae TaxID=3075547 RepID=A0ABU2JFM6_9ACTN|nr:hypothetical protein [Jatrophihabitans sp. DSM 44399]MDT0263802.1 hypothetical protein [Jatrophihabitans sp. DSM 44399]